MALICIQMACGLCLYNDFIFVFLFSDGEITASFANVAYLTGFKIPFVNDI